MIVVLYKAKFDFQIYFMRLIKFILEKRGFKTLGADLSEVFF